MSGLLGLGLAEVLIGSSEQAPVILGSVIFNGHEVPSRISLGGAHAVTIHRLPGGGRIIDAMGVDDGAIAWSGFFTGPAAADRARLIDAMRQAGNLVSLSFGDYFFDVVIVHFEYDLQDRGALISYRIRTEVAPATVVPNNDTSTALSTLLSSDAGSAATAIAGIGLPSLQGALTGLQTTLASRGDPTSAAGLAASTAALQASAIAIQASISASGSAFAADNVGAATPLLNGAALLGLVAAAGTMAAGVQAAAYVNRGNSWLNQLAGRSQSAPPIHA